MPASGGNRTSTIWPATTVHGRHATLAPRFGMRPASISLEQEVQSSNDDGLVIRERRHTILQQAARDGRELWGFEHAIKVFDLELWDQPSRQRDLRAAIKAPQRNDDAALQSIQQIALDLDQVRRDVGVRADVAVDIEASH